MKKLYFLSMILLATATSFGQTIYSENFGTPTASTTVANYITGTAPATFQNAAPIVYTGTTGATSMRVTGASSVAPTYATNSGGGNVFLSATTSVGHFFQVDGINTSAYTSANIQLSFGLNTASVTVLPTLEFSTNGTTWTPIAFTPTGTGWTLVSVAGGILPASSTLSLRFTHPSTVAVPNTAQFRVDDMKVFNFNSACTLVLGTPTTACDATTSGIDTYTATIPFTGGGATGHTVTATSGTVAGDSPNTMAAGNITVTGITEGTAITLNVVKGVCSYSTNVAAANCKIVNALPYYEGFPYTAATALTVTQQWAANNVSTDDILVGASSLTFPACPTTTGGSVSFAGAGTEAFSPFTVTNAGTLYTSFLMSVTDLTAVTTDLSSTYFAGLNTNNNPASYNSRIFFKRNGTQYQLGLDTASALTATNVDATLRNVGDVLRVVVAYDFTGNTLSMWVNPAATGSAPVVSITPAAAITNIGGFQLRQDTNVLTPAITIDELRISTSLADLQCITSLTKDQFNEIAGFSMYPNPVTNGKLYFNTDNNTEKTVAIYDLVGKQVLNKVVTNEMNVSTLSAGIYVVKVTEEGKTATRKLIIE